jgi:pimeloyl-ACP methyl ester carboxylesterase
MPAAPQLAPFSRHLALKQPHTVLQYFEAGPADGPPIVLIHGLQDEADTWRHVFQPLAQANRVIAFDLPGFGRSEKGPRRYDLQFYVDVTLALLDALGIAHATLVGNSLGGMIAEATALAHPARISRLILVDGTLVITRPPATSHSTLTRLLFLPSIDKRMFERLRKDPQAAYATLQPYYADLAAMPQADRDFLFQRVNERVWDEYQRRASLSVQQSLPGYFVRNARRLAARIKASPVPTRVIWGQADHIISIENGRARAALQPGTQLVTIAGAGHLPHQERPAEFLQALAAAGVRRA